jgi:hypothetical protein
MEDGAAVTGAQVDGDPACTGRIEELADVHLEGAPADERLHWLAVYGRAASGG